MGNNFEQWEPCAGAKTRAGRCAAQKILQSTAAAGLSRITAAQSAALCAVPHRMVSIERGITGSEKRRHAAEIGKQRRRFGYSAKLMPVATNYSRNSRIAQKIWLPSTIAKVIMPRLRGLRYSSSRFPAASSRRLSGLVLGYLYFKGEARALLNASVR